MDNEIKKLLLDIHKSILRIEAYIGSPKLYEN
jgi:hypothetical protein